MNAAPDASVARVVWHSQTNQVICSTSAGGVRVMYDPAISDKGAMLSAGRSHSRLNTNMFLPKHAVRLYLHLPSTLCTFCASSQGGVTAHSSYRPQSCESIVAFKVFRREGHQYFFVREVALFDLGSVCPITAETPNV